MRQTVRHHKTFHFRWWNVFKGTRTMGHCLFRSDWFN